MTVTLHVWRVPARATAAALVASRVTAMRMRRRDDVRFAKVLGTASARFVPTATTLRRWAVLTCWASEPDPSVFGWWDGHADERAELSLQPLSVRGSWDGRTPFAATERTRWDGAVVAVTRATLRPAAASRFYRAVGPVARELRSMSGCRAAFGIGEAPLMRQGTVSVWESAEAMRAFAYRSPAHRHVVDVTPAQRWYREEMFARFALLHARGTLDGVTLDQAVAA